MKYVSFKWQSSIEGPGLSLSCAQGVVAALQPQGWGGSGGAGARGGWSVVPLGGGRTGRLSTGDMGCQTGLGVPRAPGLRGFPRGSSRSLYKLQRTVLGWGLLQTTAYILSIHLWLPSGRAQEGVSFGFSSFSSVPT